MKNHNFCSASL